MRVDKIAIAFFQVTVLRKSHRGGFSGECETYTLISIFVSFKKKKNHNFISLIPTEAN